MIRIFVYAIVYDYLDSMSNTSSDLDQYFCEEYGADIFQATLLPDKQTCLFASFENV